MVDVAEYFAPPKAFDPSVLWHRADLPEPVPRTATQVRVRRGIWVPRDVWSRLCPEQRHAALVHATAMSCRKADSHVFARTSAAALWGLPMLTAWPSTVHTVSPARPSPTPLLQHHVGHEAQPAVVQGLQVTSVARTVLDLARFCSLAQGVTSADFAVRQGLCTMKELTEEFTAIPLHAPGRRQASLAVDMVDPRSMSPGESLSRVQIMLLRLPRPELQVPFSDRAGHIGDVDFYWEKQGLIGEFDGRKKYRAAAVADGRVEEIVWREKRREDRLRSQARVARWVWATAVDQRALGDYLASQGLRPLARRQWFDLRVS